MQLDRHHPNLSKLTRYACFWIVAGLLGTTLTASAEPYKAKYRGSSATWVPDYAGTIQMSVTGNLSQYTAVADVELRQMGPAEPNSSIPYEMRGVITMTSPEVITNPNQGTTVTQLTCTPVKETPVSIEKSRMTLYPAGTTPANTYTIRIGQFIRTTKCVSQAGVDMTSPNGFIDLSFDSSSQSAEAAMAQMPSAPPPQVTQADLSAMETASKQGQDLMALIESPAFKQEVAKLRKDAQQGGQTLSEAEAAGAVLLRWQQSGKMPKITAPQIDPKFEAYSRSMKSDYSRYKPIKSLNRLTDQASVTDRIPSQEAGKQLVITKTFSWDLRRVNAR
jgi:hypothetical protein